MQIHILDQADDKKTVNVIFHISIPATNNTVGVSWQTALVGYLGGSDAIVSNVADATELIDLKAGVKAEVKTSVRFSKLGLTDAQKLAEVKAAYTNLSGSLLSGYQTQLAYYGYKGDAV